MTPTKPDRILLYCLRIGAFLCFAGWTWVHFYWEGPYGILLWHDSTYALAEHFGISWEDFVGTGANDGLVQAWIHRMGWLYLACCVMSLAAGKKSYVQMAALLGGSGLLVILSFAKYLSAQRQLPMFVEHGGQMLIPVILVMALALGVRHRVTVVTAMIAFVMTFAGHGLYALGFYWPTPANFYGMTSIILGAEHETVLVFLRMAGILDLIVCIGIFIPHFRVPCSIYAVTWGLLTALARPVAGMSLSLNYWGADQFLHEAVLRGPHFMIPLYLYLLWRKEEAGEEAYEEENQQFEPEENDGAKQPSLAGSF